MNGDPSKIVSTASSKDQSTTRGVNDGVTKGISSRAWCMFGYPTTHLPFIITIWRRHRRPGSRVVWDNRRWILYCRSWQYSIPSSSFMWHYLVCEEDFGEMCVRTCLGLWIWQMMEWGGNSKQALSRIFPLSIIIHQWYLYATVWEYWPMLFEQLRLRLRFFYSRL